MLLVGIVGFTGAAAALVVLESRAEQAESAKATDFQRLVGGLGFGTSLDASCGFAFDPRFESFCRQEIWPIPAGGYFCAAHPGSAFAYPPLMVDDEGGPP